MKHRRTARKVRYVIYKQTILNPMDHFLTFLGAFTGIGAIGFLQSLQVSLQDNLFLIGSFGASAVLLYGVSNSPLAQPRNLIGGHVLSGLIGVSVALLFPEDLVWLTSALAVSIAIVVMQITKTIHPPGGATALIAVIGSDRVKELGYWYVLFPVLSGAMILLLIAFLFNNISEGRKYPYHLNYSKGKP